MQSIAILAFIAIVYVFYFLDAFDSNSSGQIGYLGGSPEIPENPTPMPEWRNTAGNTKPVIKDKEFYPEILFTGDIIAPQGSAVQLDTTSENSAP